MSLRVMERADVARVAELELAIQTSPWTTRTFLDELCGADRDYVVAERNSDIVGYGGIFTVLDESHVTTVGVDPNHRRGGVGREIVAWLVAAARSRGATAMTLEVRVSNAAAQGLYRVFGFGPVGVRPSYYPTPTPAEDALIMWVHDIGGVDMDERLSNARASLHGATHEADGR